MGFCYVDVLFTTQISKSKLKLTNLNILLPQEEDHKSSFYSMELSISIFSKMS